MNHTTLTVYGANWCSDCRRAKNVLNAAGVAYTYIEVDKDEAAAARAIEISGAKSIPVIVFPDGSYLIEPSNEELLAAVGTAGLLGGASETTHDLGGGD
jgi:glutaredoxin-like protein